MNEAERRLWFASNTDCCQYDCFKNGIKYLGNDVGRAEKTSSVAHCQLKCRNDAQCKFFSYQNGWCNMKSSGSSPVVQAGVISGPKVCDLAHRRDNTIYVSVHGHHKSCSSMGYEDILSAAECTKAAIALWGHIEFKYHYRDHG